MGDTIRILGQEADIDVVQALERVVAIAIGGR